MIKNLDNTEISCVYYQFKKHYDELNDSLNKGYRVEQQDVDMESHVVKALFLIKIDQEEVAAIKSSHYYLTVKSIVDKLAPIIELIEEVEPSIKNKLDE